MNIKIIVTVIIIVLMPVLLFACTTLKPVEKLTDKELIDKYYKTDLKLYMVKRAGRTNPSTPEYPKGYGGEGSGYSSKDIEKIKKN
ncbi:MAG: hypothetical protein SCARUB_03485 [Candidatus Scalindua rubra]|uniref:Lipoprotein n=1 Tax=Candidatus Scalindua rubra TaxID=1872076 RepID=A0A1E3X6Y5_9BACT|nr:MAG: hypothetical protein SCARUB_03485 [Candidatus Scalindua rubra]